MSLLINRNSLRYRLEVVILVEHLGHFRDTVTLAWAKRLRNWVLMKRDRFSEQEHNEFALEIRRLNLVIN
jgi:hypothetical protein